MRPRGEIEALRQVTREAAADAPPELDWERMEQRLLVANDSRPRWPSEPRSARPALWKSRLALAGVAATLAVAAAFALFGGSARVQPVPRGLMSALPTERDIDGDALAEGAVVRAGAELVHVRHAGRATWTLGPGSVAHLASRGEFLTVALDEGVVRSRVVPSPRAESFAVEVGATRVAVHGTVFSVRRDGDQALVSVTEGTVVVGPLAVRGRTEGFSLPAPSSGSFFAGGLAGPLQGRAAEFVAPAAAAPSPAAASPESPAHARGERVPGAPSDADLERVTQLVADGVQQCFSSSTSQGGDVRVTLRTTLRFSVQPDGSVVSPVFDPPLAPAVHSCAAPLLADMRFSASRRGGKFSRKLDLQR